MGNRSSLLSVALMAVAIALTAGDARAGGFQITELCGKCQGYRNAGAAARASDPSTVYFNPAGIAFLPFTEEKKNLTDVSFHYISGTFDFSDKGSQKAIQDFVPGPPPPSRRYTAPGGPAEGKRNDDGGEDALVPNFYYARKIDDVVGFGLSVNIPYGLVTKYSNDWVGRYSSTKSDLKTVNINPAFSFKIHETFSLGFGVNIAYAKVELKNALDLGTLVTANIGTPLANALFPGLAPSSINSDGKVRLSGDDMGFGWNVGGLLNLNQGRTRLGVSYRSKMEFTFDGHLRTKFPRAYQNRLGVRSKLDAEADLDLPATLNFGISHDVTPKWTLLAGATWTEWEDFDEIKVKVEGGGTIVEPQKWDNSWRFQLGTEYRPSSKWAFRAGTEWDESPQSNEFRNSRIPDEDRLWLALGFSYKPAKDLSVDFAYSHIFVDDYNINQKEVLTEQAGELLELDSPFPSANLQGVGNTTVGEYEAHANVFTLGVRWRF